MEQIIKTLLKSMGFDPASFIAEMQKFTSWIAATLKENDARLIRIEKLAQLTLISVQEINAHLTNSPPEMFTTETDPSLLPIALESGILLNGKEV